MPLLVTPWMLGRVSDGRAPRTRAHPAAVVTLLAVVWVVGVLLVTSDRYGEGARNVGTTSSAPLSAAPPGSCPPTTTNPGGRNNYRPGAPQRDALGRGFVVEGTVRGADCAPLPGVRLQVWAQTVVAGETTNRAATRTGADGRFRFETDPLRAQFGEPNVHVAHDDTGDRSATERFRPVFVRHVVAAGDTGAVVDLVLVPEP